MPARRSTWDDVLRARQFSVYIQFVRTGSHYFGVPCSYADRELGYQRPRGLMSPFALEVAAEAAARLPYLHSFMYEGPHGDCRAAFAALRVLNLQVCDMTPAKYSKMRS